MPLGTGPYRVTEFVPDTRILFEAHTGYWGGAPAAAAVELFGIRGVSTRVAALLNGEIDMAMDLPPDQVETAEDGGANSISTVSPLNANIFAIVGANAPLDRKEIRQAPNLSIDRQAIVEQLLGGFGVWPSGIQSNLDPLYTERPLRGPIRIGPVGYSRPPGMTVRRSAWRTTRRTTTPSRKSGRRSSSVAGRTSG